MDFTKTSQALEQYRSCLGDRQSDFLQGLWKIASEHEPEIEWEAPDRDQLLKMARKHKHWLSHNTPQIDRDWFIACLSDMRDHIKTYAKNKNSSVFIADLSLIKQSDLKNALCHTDQAVQSISKRLGITHMSDENGMFALAVVSTIRVWARAAAELIYCPEILDYDFPETPCCPCCGASAALAVVRPTVSVDGGHRNLYCAHCGTMWHYPRIKCSHCGSVDPHDLRYFYSPSDEAHQMHVCRDCETALPSVSMKHLDKIFDPMVEEAVSLPLAYHVMNSQLVQDFLDRKDSK